MLALPIYLLHFGLHHPAISLVSTLAALWLFLGFGPKEACWGGFFTGLFWFWWIALSFRYYDLGWMMPLVVLFVGVVYGAIFWALYRLAELLPAPLRPFGRAVVWLLLGSIHPFGFNWLIPDMLLLFGGIHPDKLRFGAILFGLAALRLKGYWRFLAIIALAAFVPAKKASPPPAPLDIELVTTQVAQEKKWLPSERQKIVAQNLSAIEAAIAASKDVVVLPESAFPLYLNTDLALLERLQALSRKIAIVTGGLYLSDKGTFNSTYLFDDGRVRIMNKAVLVPFGEAVPLPSPFDRWVNETFFGGGSDYAAAKAPAIYAIDGVEFTNAICYEATHPLIYRTPTRYAIAISNNAWFIPSIEPTLQWMIIKYYATMSGKMVYHATNIAKTAVIK